MASQDQLWGVPKFTRQFDEWTAFDSTSGVVDDHEDCVSEVTDPDPYLNTFYQRAYSNLQMKAKYADLTIIHAGDNYKHKVHRAIVAPISKFFEQACDKIPPHGTLRMSEEHHKIDAATLHSLLSWVYGRLDDPGCEFKYSKEDTSSDWDLTPVHWRDYMRVLKSAAALGIFALAYEVTTKLHDHLRDISNGESHQEVWHALTHICHIHYTCPNVKILDYSMNFFDLLGLFNLNMPRFRKIREDTKQEFFKQHPAFALKLFEHLADLNISNSGSRRFSCPECGEGGIKFGALVTTMHQKGSLPCPECYEDISLETWKKTSSGESNDWIKGTGEAMW